MKDANKKENIVLSSLAPILCIVYTEVWLFLNATRGSVFKPDSCEIVLNCCSDNCCCFCVSARCLRLDYTEASAKHPNSGEAERLQRSFQITGSETQKWISSSKMKTEAGVESFPKCLCMTVCLFQPFLSYAYCVKLLILLHKHRKCKNVRILAAVWIEALQLPASSFFKFKDGLSDSFQNCCCLAVNVCVCGPSKMLSVRSLSFQ